MRVGVVAGAAALALAGGVHAAWAEPIGQSESGSTSESTCLWWYDTEGEEQGSVNLCGGVWESEWGTSRSVSTSRYVQTCDENGGNCTDAYSEHYGGPASLSEFSMDMDAGVATFQIVLAGENGDSCSVDVTAQATGPAGSGSPYPAAWAYTSPPYVTGSATYDGTTYTAWAYGSEYPTAGLDVRETSNEFRPASGSGTVCNWIQPGQPGTGGMSAWSDHSTSYWVSPRSL